MNSDSTTDSKTAATPKNVFLLYVVIAYLTQGIAQHFCLIAQPLEYYMLKSLSMNAAQVAALLSVLMIPWMVKPIFGILSDSLPLAGYRRKSYLTLFYALSGTCYLISAATQSLNFLIAALFLTALGMAAGTAIICGLTLEVGRPDAETRKFQALQAVSYYSANIGSFLLGGYLCGHLLPSQALSTAAIIASVPCFVTALASWFLVREEKTKRAVPSLTALRASLAPTKFRRLLYVALFMCCWSFSPGFGTPLYFHQTKDLGFDQIFIGQLGALFSVGMIAGALFYRKFLDKKTTPRKQAKIAVIVGTTSTLAYLLLGSPTSAVCLELFRGFAEMLAILLVYGLAADVSPKNFESTTIAILVAAYNIAEQISINVGASLYTYVFESGFSPLIVVSAVATLACWLLIPLLPESDQHVEPNQHVEPEKV
ncbi:MAG: MFS transporter [Candidatus Obscuribacterales bacterium]|jgi:predicted MFS family arabinose efflux permease